MEVVGVAGRGRVGDNWGGVVGDDLLLLGPGGRAANVLCWSAESLLWGGGGPAKLLLLLLWLWPCELLLLLWACELLLLLWLAELLRLLWRWLSELLLCGLHRLGRLNGHARLLLLLLLLELLWRWSALRRRPRRSRSWPPTENVSQAIKEGLWLRIGLTSSQRQQDN